MLATKCTVCKELHNDPGGWYPDRKEAVFRRAHSSEGSGEIRQSAAVHRDVHRNEESDLHLVAQFLLDSLIGRTNTDFGR